MQGLFHLRTIMQSHLQAASAANELYRSSGYRKQVFPGLFRLNIDTGTDAADDKLNGPSGSRLVQCGSSLLSSPLGVRYVASRQPNAIDATAKRRRLRFSLRTLLVLVTALAVWFGTWAKYARDQKSAVDAVREVGGEVSYAYQYDKNGDFLDKASPWAPAWLRNTVGEDYFVTVVGVGFFTSPAVGGGTHAYNNRVTDYRI